MEAAANNDQKLGMHLTSRQPESAPKPSAHYERARLGPSYIVAGEVLQWLLRDTNRS